MNQEQNPEQKPVTKKELQQHMKVVNMGLTPLTMIVFILVIINVALVHKVYDNWIITIIFVVMIVSLWRLGLSRQTKALKEINNAQNRY